MQIIRSKTNRRKAIISDNAPYYHVTFWNNEEQISHRQSSRMYKTHAGALRAANKWVA